MTERDARTKRNGASRSDRTQKVNSGPGNNCARGIGSDPIVRQQRALEVVVVGQRQAWQGTQSCWDMLPLQLSVAVTGRRRGIAGTVVVPSWLVLISSPRGRLPWSIAGSAHGASAGLSNSARRQREKT